MKERKNWKNNFSILWNFFPIFFSFLVAKQLINENICSDCRAQKPTWLSINWLTIICIDCSAVRGNLGVQITKIKTLELDNISDEYIELFSSLKQTDINDILENKIN